MFPPASPGLLSNLRRQIGDGSQMPGNKCSNCSAYNFECKYEEAAKVRNPSVASEVFANLTLLSETRTPQRVRGLSWLGSYVKFFVSSYVESLESRLEKMENLLQRVRGRGPTGHHALISLITPSCVPTPTLRKNWERLSIDKPSCGTPYRAPFSRNPVPPHIDHLPSFTHTASVR
jgi:hypothetical protein